VADITYLPTWSGFLYLAVVVDACSRRVVGWSMAGHLRTELIVEALDMALARRRPKSGLVHHSDRGTQYTSLAFGRRCREAGISLSMGSTGDAYDNAMAESFFASLETELIDRSSWRTPSRRPAGRLRLHRGLLQPTPPPFCAGLSQPSRVREEVPFRDHRCLTIHRPRKRGNSKSMERNGSGHTGRQLRWHPGGGHHGPKSYWYPRAANRQYDRVFR
jgi:putative transposase